jgi:hypothetical protein
MLRAARRESAFDQFLLDVDESSVAIASKPINAATFSGEAGSPFPAAAQSRVTVA